MPTKTPRRQCRLAPLRQAALIGAGAVIATSTAWVVPAAAAPRPVATTAGSRLVSFHGYRIDVPSRWNVVDFTTAPHACLRFDRPSVYLGHAGDQSACPAHLIGGAPGMQIEPLDSRSITAGTHSSLTAARTGAVPVSQLPPEGPVRIAVQGAGVLVTAIYGNRGAAPVATALADARVLPGARPAALRSLPSAPTAPVSGVKAPGSYQGQGFDACTAPSQSAMDAWRPYYQAVGVYIGGVNRGCSQPNLTSAWVSHQVSAGWHLIPTYVGLQAPCTSFYNRMSSDPRTARAQGRAAARDAVAKAGALGIGAASTLYSDVEGYNNLSSSCVTAVLNYVSGWTHVLHANSYLAGVYSSAASGISDLSAHYTSTHLTRPDDIWMAWWNGVADVSGGSYLPDSQWSNSQRIHQFDGNVFQSHGGYKINIDRDYLDVGSAAAKAHGCPTNLNFAGYDKLRRGDQGDEVLAAQCLLTKRGFNPGTADGTLGASTAAAIGSFKSTLGLADNAVLNHRSWTALLAAGHAPFLQQGVTGRAVRKLQRSLTASLRRTVAINGTFDGNTRTAVKTYQTTHGLPVRGTVGARTWRALQTAK
jgi:glycoside hydrolase-like protein/putative peptidoglycan binding protein